LGLPESFDIAPETISTRYRLLAKQLHPDKYENKSDQEQAISRQYSTEINRAYRTLIDPVSRAQALLAVKGVRVQDADPDELEEIRAKTVDDLISHQNDFRQAFADNDLEAAKEAVIKLIYRTRIMSAVCNDY
ncbi:hypothetical protein BVRB_021430, partial [Beta vulgaris subsp. vulgaris]